MAKIDDEFLDWVDKQIYSYLYALGGGYPGQIYVKDDVLFCNHNGNAGMGVIYKLGEIEIYSMSGLRKAYKAYTDYYELGKKPNYQKIIDQEKSRTKDMAWIGEGEMEDDDYYEGYIINQIEGLVESAEISFDDLEIKIKEKQND